MNRDRGPLRFYSSVHGRLKLRPPNSPAPAESAGPPPGRAPPVSYPGVFARFAGRWFTRAWVKVRGP